MLYNITKEVLYLISKIINIKNLGKFKNFDISNSDWNGLLNKVNVIYAPNGSGKTTLSLMFESLSNKSHLISKKNYSKSGDQTKIKIIYGENEIVKFDNNKWEKSFENIEVFNSFYLEENIYKVSVKDSFSKINLFELENATEVLKWKKEVKELTILMQRKKTARLNRRKVLRKVSDSDINKRNLLTSQMAELTKEREELKAKRFDVHNKIKLEVEKGLIQYKNIVNTYLSKFSRDLKILSIEPIYNHQSILLSLVYDIEINGSKIVLDDRIETSLKYHLSEGDKNALALSFFLAKLEMNPNIGDCIIIVDDPFTSFDSRRKLVTIKELARLSEKTKQMILLTHDLYFAKDFLDKANNSSIQSLEIKRINEDSLITTNNIREKTLTGYIKDLSTLHDFLNVGSQDEFHKKEVLRCIRPCLEGIFRIKYFNEIQPTEWLGDIIKKIRNSDENSNFFRLKNQLHDIEDINDYSKSAHHSNPEYYEQSIDENELRDFVIKTLDIIRII